MDPTASSTFFLFAVVVGAVVEVVMAGGGGCFDMFATPQDVDVCIPLPHRAW